MIGVERKALARQIAEIEDDHTRWMVIGFLAEQHFRRTIEPKKPRGRPKTGADKDGWRAYALWAIAQNFPEEKRVNLTNRELISIARQVEDIQDLCLGGQEILKVGHQLSRSS